MKIPLLPVARFSIFAVTFVLMAASTFAEIPGVTIPPDDGVKHAEAFEICAYGSQPDQAGLRQLFPFFE